MTKSLLQVAEDQPIMFYLPVLEIKMLNECRLFRRATHDIVLTTSLMIELEKMNTIFILKTLLIKKMLYLRFRK